MRLSPGVSYHPIDDEVFVHHADNQKDYLFGGIALDVFEHMVAYPDAPIEDLISHIADQYEVAADEIQSDIQEFVELLSNEDLVIDSRHADAQWSNDISTEVAARCAQRHRLFSMMFELTYRCPARCIHCYIDDFAPDNVEHELTLDEYKSILHQARSMGCIKVLLTGGEPLMRSDLCDVVEHATSLGLIVDLYTTGLGLTDEIFDRLCAAHINSVSFSLYGGTADMHDRITGLCGSFDKTLKAMLMFKAAGVNTFFKSVAMRQNFEGLEGIYGLARRLKVLVSISPRIVEGHECKRAADFRLSEEQYEKFFETDARHSTNSFRRSDPQSVEEILESTGCSAGLNSLEVDPYGGVRPCSLFNRKIGSLRADPLEEIWKRVLDQEYVERLKMRDLTPHCRKCDYIEHCQPCIAELLNGMQNDCGDVLIRARAAARARGGDKR